VNIEPSSTRHSSIHAIANFPRRETKTRSDGSRNPKTPAHKEKKKNLLQKLEAGQKQANGKTKLFHHTVLNKQASRETPHLVPISGL
jgi:hypothetical protein